MKSPIIPITLGLTSLAAMDAFFWWAFGAQRDDVAIARAFLTHIAAENHSEARALLTPALAVQLPTNELASRFGQIEPWEHLGFTSRSSNSSSGTRRTELYGTGTAISGCESDLSIRLINGLIDAVNVTPLCPRTGTDV